MSKILSSWNILPVFVVLGLTGCQFSKVDPDEAARKQQEEQQRQKDKEQAEKSFSEKMTLAIQQNDLKALQTLISNLSVTELETANENGEMWFHEVIRKDRYHFAAALIAKGLSVFKVEERSGLSPLELSKKSSHVEMLALLEGAAKVQFQEVVQLLDAGELQKALELQQTRGLSLTYQNSESKTFVAFVLQNIAAYKKADLLKLEDFVLQAPSLTVQDFNQLFEAKSEFSEDFLSRVITQKSFQALSVQEQESFLMKAYETSRFGKASRDLIIQNLANVSESGAKTALNFVLKDLQAKRRTEGEFLQGLQILALSKNAGLITSFDEMKSLILKINQGSSSKLSDLEKTSDLLMKMLSGDLSLDFVNIKDLKSQGSLGQSVAQKILVADRIAITSDFFQSATTADRAQVFALIQHFSSRKQKVLASQAAQLLGFAKDQADYDLIFDRVLVEPSMLTQEQWLQQLMVILEKRWGNTSGLTPLFSTRASLLLNEERWKALDEKTFHAILDKEARFVVIGELDATPAQVFRAMVQARGRKMTDGLVLRFGTQGYHISNYSFFIAVHLAKSPSAGSSVVLARLEGLLRRLEIRVTSLNKEVLRFFWNDLRIISVYTALEKTGSSGRWESFEVELSPSEIFDCIHKNRLPISQCNRKSIFVMEYSFDSFFEAEFMNLLKFEDSVDVVSILNQSLLQLDDSSKKFQDLALASIGRLKRLKDFSSLLSVWRKLGVGMPSRDRVPFHVIGREVFMSRLGHNFSSPQVVEIIESLKFAILKSSPRLVLAIVEQDLDIIQWTKTRSSKYDSICGKDYDEPAFLELVDAFLPGIKRSSLSPRNCLSEVANIRIPIKEQDPNLLFQSEQLKDSAWIMSGSEYQWIMFLREMDKERDQIHPLAVQWLDSLPRFLFEK